MNNRIFEHLFFILISILGASCSSPDQGNSKQVLSKQYPAASISAQFENMEKGNILGHIKCKADSSSNYALYIPVTYKNDIPFPVVFFFDPHASGALPLKKYKDLADKYGYIFAGSNNSKNGNSVEVNGAFAGKMMNDLKGRLNIDRNRIYTSGFSGGSRVASAVAIYKGGISAVIGCGAGFPAIEKSIENKFNYIGIAGNEDFNFNEMDELEKMLGGSKIEHIFMPFQGKHEWCPLAIMDKAFLWLQFKAMKQNQIIRNDSAISSFLNAEQISIENLIRKKMEDEALTEAALALNFTSGLANDVKLVSAISRLEKSDAIKKAIARKIEISRTEKTLKEQYLNAMALKDEAWWATETKRLNNINQFPYDQHVMNKRLFSYLSLACYMNINQLMQAKQVEEAKHFTGIYRIIDPNNPEGSYLQALIEQIEKQNDKAILNLKNAAKLGFKEIDRYRRDFPEIAKTMEGESIGVLIKQNESKEE